MDVCLGGEVPLAGYLRPAREGMSPTDLMNDEIAANNMKMLKKTLFPLNSSLVGTKKKHITYQGKSKFKEKKKQFRSLTQK